jgi:hypothetical protein
MIFKRKPKIEFFSLMPEVAAIAPILPANKFRPEWLVSAGKDYADQKQQPSFGKEKLIHTAKCPGIYNFVKYGWVMTTWQDVLIHTNGDGLSFEWKTPANQKFMAPESVGDMVGHHSPAQLSALMGGFHDALQTVIKIQTPWRCLVPEGYYLMEGPLPYSNERRFTTLPGFFSSEYGVAQMNVQLKWHVLNGEVLLKAGTPIAHYMLVPKSEAELVVAAATPEQLAIEAITQAELARRFVTDRSASKCLFSNLFKR